MGGIWRWHFLRRHPRVHFYWHIYMD